MENVYTPKASSGINKPVFFIAVAIGVIVNLLFLLMLQFYAYVDKNEIKQPEITYIPEPVEKPVKKKIEKEEKTTKKLKKRKTAKHIKTKKGITKPKKSTGKFVEKEPEIPAFTPPLPENKLPEEKISLPEEELPEENFSDVPSEKIVIKEFKAVSPGKFNPSFGTELSKLDKGVKGTAKNRKLIFRPSPPTVRSTSLPPPIKVKLWINKDGTVGNVQLLETTGNPDIDKKVREYVLSWKFNRAEEKQWAITTIRFKPENK